MVAEVRRRVTLKTPFLCPDGRKLPLCGTTEAAVQLRWGNAYGDIWTRLP